MAMPTRMPATLHNLRLLVEHPQDMALDGPPLSAYITAREEFADSRHQKKQVARHCRGVRFDGPEFGR